MILYDIKDVIELQNQLNDGTAQVKELQKLSDLNANGFLSIDKVKFKFFEDPNAKDKRLRFQVYTYFDEGVNSQYIKEEFNTTAASMLQKDFKKNKDLVFGLYKIFSFKGSNHKEKLALCRKFIELDEDLEEEARPAFIEKYKSFMNIIYSDVPYSIIKIINSGDQWTVKQNLSSYSEYITEYNSISEIDEEQETSQQQEETQNSRKLF